MKKWIPAMLAAMVVLTGCSPKLPDNPIVFETGKGDGYLYLSTGNNMYVPYCPFERKYMGECIGYYDPPSDDYTESARVYVYELKGYSSDEWIIDYFPEANEGMILREINTQNIPDGLTSEYEWNQ